MGGGSGAKNGKVREGEWWGRRGRRGGKYEDVGNALCLILCVGSNIS